MAHTFILDLRKILFIHGIITEETWFYRYRDRTQIDRLDAHFPFALLKARCSDQLQGNLHFLNQSFAC
jgi:hypothetical protein